MPLVQFAPLSSLVQPALWHKLTDLKIDVLKLSDAAVPLTGSYTIGRTIKDRETGQDIALPCNLTVGAESFESDFKCASYHLHAHCQALNRMAQGSSRLGDRTRHVEKLQHHRRVQGCR